MNHPVPGPLHALQGHIEAAVAQLADSMPGGQKEEVLDGLVLIGELHDSYPALLIHDPNLTDSAKVLYLYLVQEARSRPRGAALVMPSLQRICEVLGHSRRTVVRDRALLRIGCWISCCRQVRDPSGRFRGHIYALHSEPCPLVDVVQLDSGYMRLLEESAERHYDPGVRKSATAALELIEREIGEGGDPLERPEPAARRMEAIQTIRNRDGRFFGSFVREKSESGPSAELNDSQVQNLNLAPGLNFAHPPGSNFEPGGQRVDFTAGLNFEPSCSSSIYIKTTTTDETPRNFEPVPDLRWPPSFDDNTRRLVGRALSRELPAGEQHQDILDVLAHHADDTHNPLRNPVGLAVRLCQLAKEGRFNPLGPPAGSTKADGGEVATAQQQRAEAIGLHSRISTLERLAEHTHNSDHRESLQAQIRSAKDSLVKLTATECSAS